MDEHNVYSWTREHLVKVLQSGKKPIVTNPKLLEAFTKIDRQDFLNDDLINDTYADVHDQLDYGEEIESPIIMAQLIQSLDLKNGDKVLEIGTGSGLSMAIMSYTVAPDGFVYSVERNQSLAAQARANLGKYPDIKNFEIIFNDGAEGLPARAPFNAIYSSIAFPDIPAEILGQLAIGGKMILPMSNQEIKLINRISHEDFDEELITLSKLKRIKYGVE